MSGYWPNGYWMNGMWYQYGPTWPPQTYYYSNLTSPQQTAFIVGPCNLCNRNFALVNPVQGQPVPKFCGECTPPLTKP